MNVYRATLKALATSIAECFVLENVPRIVVHAGGKSWTRILEDFTQAQHTCFWKLFDAQHFEMPQQRRRVYIAGFKNNLGATPMMPGPSMLKRPLLSDFFDDYAGTPPDWLHPDTIPGKILRAFTYCHKTAGMTNKPWVVDICASARFVSAMCEICPTMTYARSNGSGSHQRGAACTRPGNAGAKAPNRTHGPSQITACSGQLGRQCHVRPCADTHHRRLAPATWFLVTDMLA